MSLRNTLYRSLGVILAVSASVYAAPQSQEQSRIKEFGATTFVDGSLDVVGAITSRKYNEMLNVSTPTTPSTNHARLWLRNTDRKICSIFDDGSETCFGAGNSGTITGVTAGNGLTGGGVTGNVTLSVNFSSVTAQGNTFNGASQLVQLNGSTQLPAISGVNLTNLNASNLGSGTVADGRLSSNVGLLAATQTWTGSNNWTTPSNSTFTYNLTVGSMNVTGLTASLPVQTDANKQLTSAAINLSGTQATGTMAAGREPAHTGDVTNSAGSLTMTAAAVQPNIANFTGNITVSSTFTVTTASVSINGAAMTWPPANSANFLKNDGSGHLTWAAPTASPGGSSGQIQYNNASSLAGDANTFVTSSSATFSYSGGVKISSFVNAGSWQQAGNQAYVLLYSATTCDHQQTTTTSSSFVSTTLTASVTPHATTSHIELTVHGLLFTNTGSSSNAYASLFRGSTNLSSAGSPTVFCLLDTNVAGAVNAPCAIEYIDAPATTSATTYTVKIANANASTTVGWGSSVVDSCITIKEWGY